MHATFDLLPEWSPQHAVLINWPHSYSEWWDPVRQAANATYLSMVKAITLSQSCFIICYDIEQRLQIQQLLNQACINMERVHFYCIPTDDVWTRDYGPLVLGNGEHKKVLNFKFNGWGNKYPAERDNQVVRKLQQQNAFADMHVQSIDFVLEGGSIEVDGQGALLTTSHCLLSSTRNPNYSQKQIERLLQETLAIKQILWLDHGFIAGDDTDGHIDTLARFVDSQTICYVRSEEVTDEHHQELVAMEAQLETFRNSQGLSYRLVPLPLPSPIYSIVDGRRLPATYANFLITNKYVLVPIYDDPQDEVAKNVIQSCFPTREVVGVLSRSLIENYGSLHCVTMQIPN